MVCSCCCVVAQANFLVLGHNMASLNVHLEENTSCCVEEVWYNRICGFLESLNEYVQQRFFGSLSQNKIKVWYNTIERFQYCVSLYLGREPVNVKEAGIQCRLRLSGNNWVSLSVCFPIQNTPGLATFRSKWGGFHLSRCAHGFLQGEYGSVYLPLDFLDCAQTSHKELSELPTDVYKLVCKGCPCPDGEGLQYLQFLQRPPIATAAASTSSAPIATFVPMAVCVPDGQRKRKRKREGPEGDCVTCPSCLGDPTKPCTSTCPIKTL